MAAVAAVAAASVAIANQTTALVVVVVAAAAAAGSGAREAAAAVAGAAAAVAAARVLTAAVAAGTPVSILEVTLAVEEDVQAAIVGVRVAAKMAGRMRVAVEVAVEVMVTVVVMVVGGHTEVAAAAAEGMAVKDGLVVVVGQARIIQLGATRPMMLAMGIFLVGTEKTTPMKRMPGRLVQYNFARAFEINLFI